MVTRIACLNPFAATREIAQSAEEETEADGIDRYFPDDSDNGLEQDNEDRGVLDDPIWTSGNEYKIIKRQIIHFLSFVGLYVPYHPPVN